jgi:hypothetical protein
MSVRRWLLLVGMAAASVGCGSGAVAGTSDAGADGSAASGGGSGIGGVGCFGSGAWAGTAGMAGTAGGGTPACTPEAAPAVVH